MVKLRTTAFLFVALSYFAAHAAEAHDHGHDHDHEHDHDDHDHDHDHDHHSHGAHVHGAWELFAALDGAQLSVTLKGPIVDILGFEAAPANDQERQAVAALADRLKAVEVMLSLDRRADCDLSAPVAVALPESFSSEHADHAHGDHDIHDSDVELTYGFVCQSPARLGAITMTGFEAFPGIETVDAVFLSDGKQAARRLERRSQVLQID